MKLSLVPELVLAPTGGDTLAQVVAAGALVVAAWQANLVQAVAEDKRSLGEEKGDVIGQVLPVESRMDRHIDDGSILMRDWLNNSPGIPLTAPHKQIGGSPLVIIFPVKGSVFVKF